jgi:hypothetical protein
MNVHDEHTLRYWGIKMLFEEYERFLMVTRGVPGYAANPDAEYKLLWSSRVPIIMSIMGNSGCIIPYLRRLISLSSPVASTYIYILAINQRWGHRLIKLCYFYVVYTVMTMAYDNTCDVSRYKTIIRGVWEFIMVTQGIWVCVFIMNIPRGMRHRDEHNLGVFMYESYDVHTLRYWDEHTLGYEISRWAYPRIWGIYQDERTLGYGVLSEEYASSLW